MSRLRSWFIAPAAWMACTWAGPAAAQYAADYTYVKMSLTVPWTLYFVFLAGVLIPFVVMIVLAWRSAARPPPEPASAETEAPTPGAP